ncbi:glucose-6-phosphate isomerase [Sneathiella limimaris]|uniref:glucose-6-phosphate isomerase n=1 Tax=Sneathiella limimaris TaxID=1964213 RepID=UPI00146D2907|nr:glucose-6-phosphate isomerase [Sneathiella limimaris]
MTYRQTFENCFSVDSGDQDWVRTAFMKALTRTETIVAQMESLKDQGRLPILSLPEQTDDLEMLSRHPFVTDKEYERFVVVGIGGSSLGGQVLVSLRERDEAPYLNFWDTLDYHVMLPYLKKGKKLRSTRFLLISKSGTTPEIMAQTLMVIEALNNMGGADAVKNQCLAICEPGDNPLGYIADKWGIERLDHDPNVGGRYSGLSLVGALPALIAGIDMCKVREGAKEVLDDTLNNPESAARVGASMSHALNELCGVSMNVIMPYAKQLEPFTHWYRQLWAESIGKEGRGTTPLNALGPIDQHSQLQLWLDGPNDKFFSLIINRATDSSPLMDVGIADNIPALDYLKDHKISDVVQAEANATAKTLADRGKYLRCIYIDKLDEKTIGSLLMHFMLETIIACHLLGVNPFDQPAVEEGKKLTKMYLKGD